MPPTETANPQGAQGMDANVTAESKSGWLGIDRGAWVLLILAAVFMIGVLGGCDGFGDGVARLIGAPTPTEMKQLEQQTADANEKREAAESALAEVVEVKDELDGQLAQLEQRIQQRVAQLPLLGVDERTDALIALARLQDEQTQLLAASGKVAKQYTELQRDAEKWSKSYAQLRAKVNEKVAESTAAVDTLGDKVRGAGGFLSELGVPVGPYVEIAAKSVAGVGSLVLGLLGIKRQANKAAQANATAGALKEVVVNTERFDLISGDESIKAAARNALSPTASAVLAAVTSGVQKGEAAAVVRGGSIPGPTKIS